MIDGRLIALVICSLAIVGMTCIVVDMITNKEKKVIVKNNKKPQTYEIDEVDIDDSLFTNE